MLKMQLIKLINVVVVGLAVKFGQAGGGGERDFSRFSQNKKGKVINRISR